MYMISDKYAKYQYSPLKRPYTGPIAINIYLTLTPYRSDLNAKFLPTTESGMVEEDG